MKDAKTNFINQGTRTFILVMAILFGLETLYVELRSSSISKTSFPFHQRIDDQLFYVDKEKKHSVTMIVNSIDMNHDVIDSKMVSSSLIFLNFSKSFVKFSMIVIFYFIIREGYLTSLLTLKNAKKLKWIGIGLITIVVIDFLSVNIAHRNLNAKLQSDLFQMMSRNAYVLGRSSGELSMELIMGIATLILSRVFKYSVQMKEESELTI